MLVCVSLPVRTQGAIVAIENSSKNIYGFQFHPEVAHTEMGMEMIKHFLLSIAGVVPDWSMTQVVEEQERLIATTVSVRLLMYVFVCVCV